MLEAQPRACVQSLGRWSHVLIDYLSEGWYIARHETCTTLLIEVVMRI